MRGMMRKASAMLAVLVLSACAGNQQGGGMDGDTGGASLRVTVQNDGTIPTQVRVYLVPASGAEVSLGSLGTLGTETLTTDWPVNTGQYRLRAEGGTGYTLTSPIIPLRRGDSIVWDMRRNVVQRQ